MRCAIWYHLYKLKNVKSIHGEIACNFTKSNTPPWMFFTFFKLYEWYQIAQRITISVLKSSSVIPLDHSFSTYAIFSEKLRTCVYQGVGNAKFFGKFCARTK